MQNPQTRDTRALVERLFAAYERGDSQQLFEQLDGTFRTGRCESFSPRSSASLRGL